MTKTDNEADYKAHLQEHMDNTVANLKEAEDYLEKHAGELTAAKKHLIEDQNDRRKESIKGFTLGKNS
ncbi:spore protein [Desulfosporosinus meridiei]|uniref:Small, acid-soluble spore protein tlp n=1 Tax=Desulfosporosinus meridiei (strain ATCC BAA-275 / DSM 13257 / KCTC 12902 / NCIMB 13706 / S10) TaxID=768704 RepID=J7IN33_DESMD|nr:spore protein [Desulfosporosinus meridiei]AFQ43207.1 hypothetical protein Desmer_1190 [Desulfosporosinus meridiei DSM 13257]